MLELYHHGSSVCAAKVRLALTEKGVSWEGHYVDILVGEQFLPEFLKLNPNAMVPVLVHDTRVILESTVINEYVDEVFDGPALRASSAIERAAMRIWTKLVDESLHPAVAPLTFGVSHRYVILELPQDQRERFINETPDPARRKRKQQWVEQGLDAPDVKGAIQDFRRAFGQMEQALSRNPWLAGGEYSLADVALTPYVMRLEMLGMWEIWRAEHPSVESWFARIKSRPSFDTALFKYLPDKLRTTMLTNGRRSAGKIREIMAEDQ